jgi:hypothetical protein
MASTAAAAGPSGGGGSSPSPPPLVAAYVTVPNKEVGRKIAGGLVGEKLAACVNIIPGVESGKPFFFILRHTRTVL